MVLTETDRSSIQPQEPCPFAQGSVGPAQPEPTSEQIELPRVSLTMALQMFFILLFLEKKSFTLKRSICKQSAHVSKAEK